MKTIIAGSREIEDYAQVVKALDDSGFVVTEVVSGGARGVDAFGERWAAERRIPAKVFKADWDGRGKAAGGIRNQQMADYAEACVIVWNGTSKGAWDMLCRAKAKKLILHVHEVRAEVQPPFAGI